jgi:lipopolysaccharide export LptBFGC system permease protein LptF
MKKPILTLLCFFAALQFSMAQPNAEQLINQLIEEYKKDPASVFKKYASDDFIFITAQGVFWDKAQTIKAVSSAKLDDFNISEKKFKTFGNTIILTAINSSKWVRSNTVNNYKDAMTYNFQKNGNEIKWISGQHSLITDQNRNKALFREKVQMQNEGKAVDYAKYYAESHEIKGIGKGPKAAEAHAKIYQDTFPDMQLNILELFAEGDLVMARCEATGTHKGDALGFPATGKTIKTAHWTINKFNAEGKITESWNLNDDMSVMKQLGIIK